MLNKIKVTNSLIRIISLLLSGHVKKKKQKVEKSTTRAGRAQNIATKLLTRHLSQSKINETLSPINIDYTLLSPRGIHSSTDSKQLYFGNASQNSPNQTMHAAKAFFATRSKPPTVHELRRLMLLSLLYFNMG
jgi:hypothetical protein